MIWGSNQFRQMQRAARAERIRRQLHEDEMNRKELTMNMSEMFPSKFISSVDLQGKQAKVSIARVITELLDETTSKPVVYFKDRQKGLILNKTNATTIAGAFGDDTDDWVGRDIVLFTVKTQFQGKLVDAVRVSIPGYEKKVASAKVDDDDLRF